MHFLYIFFTNIFYNFFLICTKVSKHLSAKYSQENKERLQKKLVKNIENLSNEEKEEKATI